MIDFGKLEILNVEKLKGSIDEYYTVGEIREFEDRYLFHIVNWTGVIYYVELYRFGEIEGYRLWITNSDRANNKKERMKYLKLKEIKDIALFKETLIGLIRSNYTDYNKNYNNKIY